MEPIALIFSALFGITAMPTNYWDQMPKEAQDNLITEYVAPMFFAHNEDCAKVKITTNRVLEEDGKYEIIIFYGQCTERRA